MSFKSILAHLEFDGHTDDRLLFATDLAGEIDAYLIGFSATALRPVHVSEMGLATDLAYSDEANALNMRRFEELRRRFMEVAGDSQYSGWRQSQDLPTKALLIHARAADLIVTGTPHGASSGDSYRSVDPGELVCNAGRPVLFVGENTVFKLPRLAIIGWKDTPQARRAVASSLPYLKLAKSILVLAVGNDRNGADGSGAQDVMRFLMRHGIDAESRTVDSDGTPETFIDIVRREGADLVVTGAFGHSRMRERVFGGFTYSLLMQSDLNRLMAG